MPPKPSAPRTKAASTAPASKKAHKSRVKKGPPKRKLSVADQLKRLFTSLCAQVDGNHFTSAVKTCDKILRLDPKDRDALQTKLFLLLQTEQYTAALTLLEASESHSAFERAYSLYRLQREKEAADLLDQLKHENGPDTARGVLHLEAQLNYRQGIYQTAFDLYNQLLDTAGPHTEEHSDVQVNLQAAQKHMDFIDTEYLHAIDGIDSAVTGTLETSPPPAPPQPSSSTLGALASISQPPGADATEQKAGAPKQARARRVPKGVIPGVTPAPDPERWLKKAERSTYTQARGKKKGAGGATQGLVESGGGAAAGGHSKGGHGKSGKKKK
ncbi:hypothetical protein FA95DRAFT_543355 [Auriscalpium vulgare]|uniref:Uncharacterized protein n=1 Tax=Auriscalpium vulgare TaxID=40419 RepID=A0ACB8RFH2_9AGAM|nr:hypothetical protein FA95DRAFT_543355 [Auriscalpium vulgare]